MRLPELTPVEELDASLEAASVRRLPAVRRRRGGLLDELLAPAPAAQGLEADLLDGQLAALRVLVHGRPCHQQVGARLRHHWRRLRGDAAVHLEVEAQAARLDQAARLANLGQHRGDELLPAPTRVDSHDQQLVSGVEDAGHGAERGGRIQGHAGPHPGGADVLKQKMEVAGGLGVHDDDLGSGIGEVAPVLLGPVDHQVRLERQAGELAHCRQLVRSVSDAGYEGAVHDVPLHPVCPRLFELLELGGDAALVGVQHRRHNLQRQGVHHRAILATGGMPSVSPGPGS